MNQIAEVKAVMDQFIAAVDRIEWESPLRIMNGFPNGCCTISSFLLGHVLQDRGFGYWYIVNGSAGTGDNHDWLENGSTVVDPTPHQFDKGKPPRPAP